MKFEIISGEKMQNSGNHIYDNPQSFFGEDL